MFEIFVPRYFDYGHIEVNSAERPRLSWSFRRKCWKYRKMIEDSRKPGRRVIDNIDVGFLIEWLDPINLAIKLLNPGGEVFIPAGTYTQTDSTITAVGSLKLVGSGPATVIKQAKTASTEKRLIEINNKNDVIVKDLTLWGDGATIFAAGYGNEFDHAIRVTGTSSNVLLKNLKILDPCGDGINIKGTASFVRVEGCYLKVTNQQASPTVGRNGLAILDNATDIQIIGNQFVKGYPAAIDIEPAQSDDYTVQRIDVIGNQVYDSDFLGISVNGSCNTTGKTVIVRDVNIVNNLIYGSEDAGIMVIASQTAGSASVENLQIKGNNLVGCLNAAGTYGGVIDVRGKAKHVMIEGNVIRQSGKNGIHVLGTSSGQKDIVVANNHVYECQQSGIFMEGQSGNEIPYGAVVNNLVKNNSQVGAGTGHGVRVEYCDNFEISGNKAFDDQGTPTQGYGIRIDNCDDLHLGRFICKGNATGDFRLTNGSGLYLPDVKILGPWYWDNLAASQAVTRMYIAGVASKLPINFDGYLVGIAAWSSETITAGSLTVRADLNGVGQSGHQCVLDSTNNTYKEEFFGDTPLALSKGDLLSILILSDASLAPAGSADIRAVLFLM